MDPVLRTRRLDDSLKDVAFAFVFSFMFGRVPFASMVVLGYMAMGLADLGRLSSGSQRLALRGAALLAVVASVLATVDMWVDSTWFAAGFILCAGFGVLLATVGFSGLAEWFGGAERWQRARAASIVSACAASFFAGMALQSPTPTRLGVIDVSGSIGGGVAMAALLGSLLFVGIATSDLRDRVKAAIVQYDADAAASVPSEHVNG